MKTAIQFYHVETPEVSLTWVGGETKPNGPGKVWLTTPGGEPFMEVPAVCVKRSSREETERRFAEDARQRQAALTRN